MTINSQLCARFNTCCKSFIKSCDQYSIAGFTSTSHIGSYKQYEPVNKLPKGGWASVTLPNKLGSADSRSMGPPNCGWLPTRLDKCTMPDPHATSNTNLNRECNLNNSRGCRVAIQRGNCRDSALSRQLCVPDISCGEEGWGSEASNKSEGPQSVCETRALQDGGPSPPPRSPPVRGLDGQNGSEGCIPPSPNPSRPSTTSHLPLGREILQIHLPTIQPVICTRVFTKLMKPVVGFLRQVGCCLIIYLDDLLVLHQDKVQIQQMIPLICQLFECLGLIINHKKSLLEPTQRLEFLGFEIHTQSMTLSIPQEKIRKIQQDARRLMVKTSVSVREVAQFVGKETATMQALPTAPLHYRALQFLMNSVHPEDQVQEGATSKFNTVVQLDPMSKSDLSWWISLERKFLSTPVALPAPSVTIESNASNQGWGAILNGQTRTGGVWSAQEQEHHINYLELLAAFLALQAFGKTWTSIVLLFRLDNVTAVTYINHKGGTASNLLCQLTITIWNWCIARNISLTAEHLPGHLNVIADQESRSVQDCCDWMLNPDIFQRIKETMGPLEVDLFASRLTKQLPQFYSWRADPEATATDAFMQDWSQQRGYANPPWYLIHHCLSKVKMQLAREVLITPFWKTQSWFPVVLELLENYPLLLPTWPDLVVMPMGQEFLMNQCVPQLIAWPISGNPTHHKVFLQRLRALCSPRGDTRPIPTMVPPLLNGLAGVTSGVEIPFRDL